MSESGDIPQFKNYREMLDQFLDLPEDPGSVQVFDGTNADHRLEDFACESPQHIREILTYIDNNGLHAMRPWSLIWNMYQMILAAVYPPDEVEEEQEPESPI